MLVRVVQRERLNLCLRVALRWRERWKGEGKRGVDFVWTFSDSFSSFSPLQVVEKRGSSFVPLPLSLRRQYGSLVLRLPRSLASRWKSKRGEKKKRFSSCSAVLPASVLQATTSLLPPFRYDSPTGPRSRPTWRHSSPPRPTAASPSQGTAFLRRTALQSRDRTWLSREPQLRDVRRRRGGRGKRREGVRNREGRESGEEREWREVKRLRGR